MPNLLNDNIAQLRHERRLRRTRRIKPIDEHVTAEARSSLQHRWVVWVTHDDSAFPELQLRPQLVRSSWDVHMRRLCAERAIFATSTTATTIVVQCLLNGSSLVARAISLCSIALYVAPSLVGKKVALISASVESLVVKYVCTRKVLLGKEHIL